MDDNVVTRNHAVGGVDNAVADAENKVVAVGGVDLHKTAAEGHKYSLNLVVLGRAARERRGEQHGAQEKD